MIKLIITDLDGSLLNDKKEVPPNFWEVEKIIVENGIQLGIASGRPYHNLVTEFDRIQDRTYFLSDNGSYMVYQGKELLVKMLDRTGVSTFVEISRQLDQVYPVLCSKEKAYMENDDEDLLKQALQYYQHYEIVDDLTKVDADILKVSLCDLINAETNSYPWFKKFKGEYKVAVAGVRWLDITAFNSNKGNAIKMLQHRLGIGFDETLVFGDYLNDLEMMQSAKYSYAMKNAHPRILEIASYTTEYDNNHAGVTRTILDLIGKRV